MSNSEVKTDAVSLPNDVQAADTKLNNIESPAGANIKTAYEAESNTNAYTDAEKTKLSGVATGATANDTDANLKARANHTGTQTASTISDFDTEVSNNASVTANTAKVTNATHTGDVTGSTALTIADEAVTYAKIQHVSATDRVLGRDTAGAGDVEEIAPTALRTMINVADGATANDTDANLKARANHTGTQTASTISDFDTEVGNQTDVAANTTHRTTAAASQHDADQIDYERADGSKKNIQATSDDVENALTDLDDAVGSLALSPTNYTPTDATITADHLSGIDTALGDRVVGPASASNLGIAAFNGTTGKLLFSPFPTIESNNIVGNTGTAASPAFRPNSSNMGIYRTGSNTLGLSSGGNPQLEISASLFKIYPASIEPDTDNTGSVGTQSTRFSTSWIGTMNSSNISLVDTSDINKMSYIGRDTVSTTNATAVNALNISLVNDETITVTTRVTARRTGGTAGTDGDGASYVKVIKARKNSTGTFAKSATTTLVEIEDQAGWDFSYDDNGSQLQIKFTGALDNNIDWDYITEIQSNK